ncbi:hypothetical protein BKA82DRAFT_4236318 [Pisolithus tinctorius]|nr:hypothetical protein BKA82DRAFT_4236318 [Pisolithus tinctorius]
MTIGDKWRSGNDWEQGHHGPKSSRTPSNPTAPQVAQTTHDAEQAAATSQATLLNTLNCVMFGDPQPRNNVNAVSFSARTSSLRAQSREETPVSDHFRTPVSSRDPTPVIQGPPLSSDDGVVEHDERSTPRASSHSLSQMSIQLLLDSYGRETPSTSQGEGLAPDALATPPQRFTAAFQPGPSGQSIPCDAPGPTTADSQSGGENLAPLLSYFSESLNSMLASFERSQASSNMKIMEGISAIQEELKASRVDANTARDVEMQSVDEFPSKQTRRPKKPRNFIPSDLASEVLTQSDIEEHKYFSTCIRLHALRLLKITDYKYLNTIKCSLTEEEVEAYELDTPGCLRVTPTNFILDCTRAKDTPYNREAFTVFAEDFLDKINNHGWYSSQTIPERYCNFDIVYGAFKAHFSYIKSRYNDFVVAPSENPVKAREDMKARLRKSSRTARKVRLLKLRLDAMAEHTSLQKHLPLVKHLGTQGISSDESEDEARRTINYPRVYPRWRSQKLAMLMWEADLAIVEFLSVAIGKRKRAGTQLRNRPHSDKFNDAAAAPPGLPVNCYDAAWLSLLHPRSKKLLRVQEKEYDFDTGENEPTANTGGPSATPGVAGGNFST